MNVTNKQLTIEFNYDDLQTLEQVILFALDYDAENNKMTKQEKNFAKDLLKMVDGC